MGRMLVAQPGSGSVVGSARRCWLSAGSRRSSVEEIRGEELPMQGKTRRFVPYLLTALLVWTATSVGPSWASAAYDALNARTVDGLSAVKADATVKHRAGKLVATDKHGRLPNNIIKNAPNADRLSGLPLSKVRTQWLSVTVDGTIYGRSGGASNVTVTHPATGTYCVSGTGIQRDSVTGNVQSQVNGFEDLSLIVTSLYNTSACPNEIRIYTTKDAALSDEPFTLVFALS